MKAFRLHAKQYAALNSISLYSVSAYLGGIRSGKTITGCHYALQMLAERPDETGGIFSNTTSQLNKATLKEFKGVLASYGLYEGEQYVINKNPEKTFGYKSKFSAHDGVWSFFNRAQIIVFSLESQIRGVEFGWVWGDEIQDATIEELNIVLGRMSGSKNPKTFYTLTPPKDNPDVDNLIYGDNSIPVTIGTTFDNRKNLEDSFFEVLKRYDPLTFAREVMCERKPLSGLNWLYTFSREKHVSDRAAYKENEIVYISFDFNVSPFVCILAHHGHEPGSRYGYISIFDEIEIDPDKVAGDSTYFATISEAIKLKIPRQYHHKAMIVTGDASGQNSHILARVGQNVWSALLASIGIGPNQLRISQTNPKLKDSRELCNGIFANHGNIFINPKCKSLIRDCEFVKANPDSTILKDNRKNVIQRADFMDVLRYYLNQFHGDFIRK